MKLVAPLSGFVAIRYAVEDVSPAPRLPVGQVVQELLDRHQFVGRSDPNQIPMILQNGSATVRGKTVAFNELQIFNGEVACQAGDTELADDIIRDLMDHFDDRFGYKFKNSEKKIAYVSTMVVEFDSGLNNVISTTHLLEKIINTACHGQRNLKRISFGLKENESGAGQPTTPFDVACAADFAIERRLGSNPEVNRFFCSAPLRTPDHLAVLQEIEAAVDVQKASPADPVIRRRKLL